MARFASPLSTHIQRALPSVRTRASFHRKTSPTMVIGGFWRSVNLPKSPRSSPFRRRLYDNGQPNDDFEPKYLQAIDIYRGYRRKIILKKLYNLTDVKSEPEKKNFVNRIVSEEMRGDVMRRRKVYVSDWTDAFKNMKTVVPAILFLYFACLSPAVSFGTIASQITEGSMGIVEFLMSAGLSGMAYSVMCGQPMAFIAPTGLTLAFISGLYRFCSLKGLPFFPVYSWVGLWTRYV